VSQNLPGPGNSLTFTGTNYISCGTNNRGISNQVTIEAWIKTTSTDYQWIAGKYLNSNFEEKGFHLYTSGGLAYINGRIGQNNYLSSGPSNTRVNDGRWHHIAGTATSSTWRIYVDGVLENTGTYGYNQADFTTTTALTIGNYAVQNGQYFQGDIDEVRVWRTVRSAADIQQNMCRKFTTVPAELVAYYRLDQSSGLTATDEGSQPTTGTLTGFSGTPWHLSGAALGDASTSLYQASLAVGARVALATASGDSAVASLSSAPARGLQLYTVNSAPSIAAGAGAANNYVGVFTVGASATQPAYTLRLRPLGGANCRSAQQRTANDQAWQTLTTTPTTNNISLLANSLSYRGEYILLGVSSPPVAISGDSAVCGGTTGRLVATATGATGYRWSTGATTATLSGVAPGTYTVTATFAGGCTSTATRVVVEGTCVLVPNIITPNNDAQNDLFTVKGLAGNDWSLDIYNRWGRAVLHSSSYHNDWGAEAAPGMYYVLLRRASTGYSYKGWVEVVR
jgi:hypothetical protein